MTRVQELSYEFCEFIPEELQPGVLYISGTYSTTAHLCCCGCGEKVVAPLSPVDWQLEFDGRSVSLYPSIGNWGFPCESHYWIRRNQVRWAPKWSTERIDRGRERDQHRRDVYFEHDLVPTDEGPPGSLLSRFRQFLSRLRT